MPILRILGIESSCDDCSASLIECDSTRDTHPYFKVLSLKTRAQDEKHTLFGGVVPEIASRSHLESIHDIIRETLEGARIDRTSIDAVAVTTNPGLIGSLLVGVSAAKAIAYTWSKPLVPINHLEGHAMSVFLDQETDIQYPALFFLVSGGHTQLYLVKSPPHEWQANWLSTQLLGRSLDDAAGEAFDKSAKLLGFPYPGGTWIDKTAAESGNPNAYDLPRPLSKKDTLDFSFSGLKTAVHLLIESIKEKKQITDLKPLLPNLCASIQEAIIDTLLAKITRAYETHECRSVVLVGGVAANSRLRTKIKQQKFDNVTFPKSSYCTDNAAMIAAAGAMRFIRGEVLEGEPLLLAKASP